MNYNSNIVFDNDEVVELFNFDTNIENNDTLEDLIAEKKRAYDNDVPLEVLRRRKEIRKDNSNRTRYYNNINKRLIKVHFHSNKFYK